MSICTISIRSGLMSSAPGGGSWTYKGFSPSSPNGPFAITPSSPLFPGISVDTIIPYGDDFTLYTDNTQPGYYKVQYNYTGSSNDLIIKIQSDTICAGVDTTYNLSETDTTVYTLTDLIDDSTCPSGLTLGGTWTDLDTAPGYSAGTFQPSASSVGTYRFRYSLEETNFDQVQCADCPDLETTLTITVSSAFITIITSSEDTCTYAASIFNPDDDTPDEATVTVATDAEKPVMSYKLVISNCQEDVVDVTREVSSGVVGLFLRNDVGDPFQAGGYFRTLRLRSTTGTDITVPLAPLGTDVATYSGVGGTTNATELTYNPVSPSVFANAISIAIQNYLGTLGYTNGTHYRLFGVTIDTTVDSSLIGKIIEISFGSKHNPSSEWLGIRQTDGRIQYIEYPGSTLTSVTGGIRFASQASYNEIYSHYPCPNGDNKLDFTVVSVSSLADQTTLDYNSITLNSATITPSITGTVEMECDSTTLTANTLNCAGSLAYTWSTTETTSSINVVTPGTYTVDVDCSSPLSSDSDSKTIGYS